MNRAIQVGLIHKGDVHATLVFFDGSRDHRHGKHVIACLGLDDLGIGNTTGNNEVVEVSVCGVIGQSSNEVKEHEVLDPTAVGPGCYYSWPTR